MSKTYNILVDILRTFCILEIVAYWHVRDYLWYWNLQQDSRIEYLFCIGVPFTSGALAMFSFMSGYLCSYNENNKWEYYKKRIVRIVLPLCASYYLMIITGYLPKSLFHFFLTLFGLHSFVVPYPQTLWYISMTIFFYLITPFLYSSNKAISLMKMFAAIIVVIALYNMGGINVDRRLLYYLPFYCLGLFFRRKALMESRFLMVCSFLVGSLMISILLYIDNGFWALVGLANCIGGFLVLYGIGLFVKRNLTVLFPIIRKLAYCSMFAYLFHRPLYTFIVNYVHFSFYVVISLMVVSLFCISYALQYGYDSLIAYYRK